jgi:Family of unknown function (DUF5681)
MARKWPDKQARTGRKSNGQFTAGTSGNPKGRPRGVRYISEACRFALAASSDGDSPLTNADAIADLLVKEARKGNMKAIELLLNRTEGPAPSVPLPLGPSFQRVKGEARIYQRMQEKHLDYYEAVNGLFDEAVEAGLIVLPEEEDQHEAEAEGLVNEQPDKARQPRSN